MGKLGWGKCTCDLCENWGVEIHLGPHRRERHVLHPNLFRCFGEGGQTLPELLRKRLLTPMRTVHARRRECRRERQHVLLLPLHARRRSFCRRRSARRGALVCRLLKCECVISAYTLHLLHVLPLRAFRRRHMLRSRERRPGARHRVTRGRIACCLAWGAESCIALPLAIGVAQTASRRCESLLRRTFFSRARFSSARVSSAIFSRTRFSRTCFSCESVSTAVITK